MGKRSKKTAESFLFTNLLKTLSIENVKIFPILTHLAISGIKPISSPTILLLHLSLLYINQTAPQLSLFYRYFHADYSSELANYLSPPLLRPRCTRLSISSHPYSVHLPNARVNQYLHSFIPQAPYTLWLVRRSLTSLRGLWAHYTIEPRGLRPLIVVNLNLKWNLEAYLHHQGKPRRRSTSLDRYRSSVPAPGFYDVFISFTSRRYWLLNIWSFFIIISGVITQFTVFMSYFVSVLESRALLLSLNT